MARQRRGGGFKPPELRGTLGTLLRTAAAQVGPLREALGDALERTAREGRSRFDDARSRFESSSSPSSSRSSRHRTEALADLGEVVLDLIRRGEIDLAQLPEVRDIVADLDELDAAAEDEAALDFRSERHAYSHDDDSAVPRRSTPGRTRPTGPAASARSRRPAASDDDGTTSSRAWTPPRPAKPAARVWRPPVDEIPPHEHDDHGHDDDRNAAPAAPSRRAPLPRPGDRKGGIRFDDDDDLAEYMHPDDVPAKKPGSDSDS